jgi:hypothetical protein
VLFALSAVLALVFFIDLCGAVYRCGCRSWWAGAAQHCNIHTPGVKHCPWCEGRAAAGASLAAILAAQAAVSFGLRRWSWKKRLAGALAAFLIVGTAAGWAAGWATGYWGG